MTQKWNLQDIRPATPRTKRTPVHDTLPRPHRAVVGSTQPVPPVLERIIEPTFDRDTESNESIPVINGTKRSRSQLIVGLVIGAFVIGGGLAISVLTGGAEVVIYPKVREMNVNAEFTAYVEKKPGELTYEIMTLEAGGERQVKATGQETVTKQATGEIEISKSTPGAERLIKNTRFQTESGLIFRIQESVVVPGAVKDSNGTSVPGTTRAPVFADEAGDKYNVSVNTNFIVPGFKEGGYTDLYNAIKAKTTQPIVDGFNGPRFIINETELTTARQSLQLELRNSLLAKVAAEKPADFTSFESAIAITYNALPPTQYGDDLVTIKEQAVLQIPLFKKSDFASFLAKETITGYEGEPVRIDNLSDLTFSYTIATTSQSNIANLSSLGFKISGVPKIVWTFDSEKMKADLMGMEKTAFNGVLSQHSGINRGEVEVKPFWKRTFPSKLSDISITEDLSTPQ